MWVTDAGTAARWRCGWTCAPSWWPQASSLTAAWCPARRQVCTEVKSCSYWLTDELISSWQCVKLTYIKDKVGVERLRTKKCRRSERWSYRIHLTWMEQISRLPSVDLTSEITDRDLKSLDRLRLRHVPKTCRAQWDKEGQLSEILGDTKCFLMHKGASHLSERQSCTFHRRKAPAGQRFPQEQGCSTCDGQNTPMK